MEIKKRKILGIRNESKNAKVGSVAITCSRWITLREETQFANAINSLES